MAPYPSDLKAGTAECMRPFDVESARPERRTQRTRVRLRPSTAGTYALVATPRTASWTHTTESAGRSSGKPKSECRLVFPQCSSQMVARRGPRRELGHRHHGCSLHLASIRCWSGELAHATLQQSMPQPGCLPNDASSPVLSLGETLLTRHGVVGRPSTRLDH
ncbi:MAG: hypothetical protein ACJAZO_002111 [Myxococcota bacterium]|jgi:hypothetical protein